MVHDMIILAFTSILAVACHMRGRALGRAESRMIIDTLEREVAMTKGWRAAPDTIKLRDLARRA